MSTIFEDVANVPHDSFVYKPRIGENTKAVQNAINKYAPDCRLEDVLFIYDYTIMGNGGKGILLTWDKIYNSSMRGTVIRFDDITRMRILPYDNYRLEITTTGGKVTMFNTFGKAEYCMPVLKLVMQYKQRNAAAKPSQPGAQTAPPTAVSTPTEVKAPSAAPQPTPQPVTAKPPAPQPAPQPIAAADRKAVLPGLYKQVQQVQHGAFTFNPPGSENTNAIRNAIAKYAKDCRLEDVILFYDYTIMGNGKKGILITWDKVYNSTGISFSFDDIIMIQKPSEDRFHLQINIGRGFVKFHTFDPHDYCFSVLSLVREYRKMDVQQAAEEQKQTAPTQRQFAGQSKVAELAAEVQKLKNVGYHAVFTPRSKENVDVIQTAISTYAKGCNREDISLFYDSSTFRNGKAGIIMTWDGFYASGLSNKEKYLTYDDILEIKGISDDLKTTFYIKTRKERSDIKLEEQIYGDYFIDTLKQVQRYRAQLMIKFPKLFLRPEPEDPILEGAYGAFFDKVKALSGTERLWYHPITDKNRSAVLAAIKAYGGSMQFDEVLLYYKDDLYTTMNEGILLGKTRFFISKHFGGIAYDDIARLQVSKEKGLTAIITLANGKELELYTYLNAEKFIQVLKLTMEYALSLQEVQPVKQTPMAVPETPPVVSQQKLQENFDRIRQLREKAASAPPPEAFTLEDMYRELAPLHDREFAFVPVSKDNQKAVQNAIKTYAKDCRIQDILLFYDYSASRNGKEGFILTRDRLYGSDMDGFIKWDDVLVITPQEFEIRFLFRSAGSYELDTCGSCAYMVQVLEYFFRYLKAATGRSIVVNKEKKAAAQPTPESAEEKQPIRVLSDEEIKAAEDAAKVDAALQLMQQEASNPESVPAPEPEPYEPVFEPVFVDQDKPKTEDMSVVTRRPRPKPKG